VYSTVADVPVDDNIGKCQFSGYDKNGFYSAGPGYLPLPSGWEIAVEDPALAASHYWSTDALVFSNGNTYFTKRAGSNAGMFAGPGGLVQSGSLYNVVSCFMQILIRSK
jgi:uncharacterized protein YbdZ (MbtH family)